jgi:hypothetical protein
MYGASPAKPLSLGEGGWGKGTVINHRNALTLRFAPPSPRGRGFPREGGGPFRDTRTPTPGPAVDGSVGITKRVPALAGNRVGADT